VLCEFPIPDGATVENLVHERMSDHFASKNGVEGVRVIDDNGDEIYRWTFSDEVRTRLDRARNKLAASALAELKRREEKSDSP
jgi:hypothetical protein